MKNKLSLSELQSRFAEILKAPTLKIKNDESLFTQSKESDVSLKTRLGIYHYAYFERIKESLAEDFPELRNTLGEETFNKLIREYLDHNPSQYPSLAQAGKNLPSFLTKSKSIDWLKPIQKTELAEQAEIEWAKCLCKWSENSKPADFSKLLELPEEERQNQKLLLSPSAQFVQGKRTLVVFKTNQEIKTKELSPSMEKLLSEIQKGRTLGELVELLETPEQLATDAIPLDAKTALTWISNWVAEGLITGFSPS